MPRRELWFRLLQVLTRAAQSVAGCARLPQAGWSLTLGLCLCCPSVYYFVLASARGTIDRCWSLGWLSCPFVPVHRSVLIEGEEYRWSAHSASWTTLSTRSSSAHSSSASWPWFWANRPYPKAATQAPLYSSRHLSPPKSAISLPSKQTEASIESHPSAAANSAGYRFQPKNQWSTDVCSRLQSCASW